MFSIELLTLHCTDESTSSHVCDVTSLCLVAFLGLEGVECLRMANHLVPQSFVGLRNGYITRIVNTVMPSPITPLKSCQLLSIISSLPFFKRKSSIEGYCSELHSLSMSTGKAHILPSFHHQSVFALNQSVKITMCQVK